ncbi:hypothetical protein [Streptomyces sp. NPDC059452]|uniref:hypothetical protein n=1 Tax=Streptomyces sp. NPDC059452 TaxID=3346835 RepID=UPI0036B3DE53
MIRYETVGSDLTDTADDVALTGHYGAIGEIFRLSSARCMLILGPAGSGKTQLARNLGMCLLSSGGQRQTGAVPVLLSLRGWRGALGLDGLLAFMARSLTGSSAPEVRALLGRGELLPLFDDFDSLPPRDRISALQALNLLAQLASFVLISKEDAYSDTVVESDMVITGSAGVRLCPLAPRDLDGWIQRGKRSSSKTQAWRSVFDHLSAHPEAPAATVLADPLLAGAARLLYTDGRASPGELIAPDATEEGLERRLVTYLVNTHIPRHRLRTSHHGQSPGAARHQHLALSMLASRQNDLSERVSTRSSFYPTPRPGSRQALATAFLLFLIFFGLALVSAPPNDPYPGTESEIQSGGFLLAVTVGCFSYVRLQRAGQGSWLPRRTVLATVIPSRAALVSFVLCPAGLVTVAEHPSAGAISGFLLFTGGCGGFVWVQARWGSRSSTGRSLVEGVLCYVILFSGLLGDGSLALHLLGFLLMATTSIHWRWLRAAVGSHFNWLPLTPGRLQSAVAVAAQQGIIHCDAHSYTFTHHALLRFFQAAPDLNPVQH